MKENVLEYKGYHACITYDAHAHRLRGVISGIEDHVDFSSDKTGEIEAEFHRAVDDYLIFCEEVGKAPCKEYRGVFNVRIQPELHRDLVSISESSGVTLNAVVERALRLFVSGQKQPD